MIERAIDRNFQACVGLPEPGHTTCITNAQTQQSALISAYLNYLTACNNGDRDAIKEALREIKELLGAINKVVAVGSGIVQEEMILSKDESVCFSIVMNSTGAVTPQDTVIVDGARYVPEAAGAAALQVTGGNGTISVSTVAGDTSSNATSSTQFTVAPGSTICFNASGMSKNGTFGGSMSFSTVSSSATTDLSSSYLPTAGAFTVTVSGAAYTMTLDTSCPFNSMSFASNGAGTLACRYKLAAVGTAELPERFPDHVWMVLPVSRNATGTKITAHTGNNPIDGWTAFPCLPNPIADYNDDSFVDNDDLSGFLTDYAGGKEAADVNHDGKVDSADEDLFLERWNYWSNP